MVLYFVIYFTYLNAKNTNYIIKEANMGRKKFRKRI